MSIFDVLPIEIIELIVEYFDGITLIRFSAVCSNAKVHTLEIVVNHELTNSQELSERDILWSTLIKKEFCQGISKRAKISSREIYYQKLKDKLKYTQLVKGRKEKVTANLVAAPSRNSSMWSRLKRTVIFHILLLLINEDYAKGWTIFAWAW